MMNQDNTISDEDLNSKIDELKKALTEDIDSHYFPNSSKKELTEKEHLDLWDEMFRLSCERKSRQDSNSNNKKRMQH